MLFLSGAILIVISVCAIFLFSCRFVFVPFFCEEHFCHACLYLIPVLFPPVWHQRRGPMLCSVRPILWCLELCAFFSFVFHFVILSSVSLFARLCTPNTIPSWFVVFCPCFYCLCFCAVGESDWCGKKRQGTVPPFATSLKRFCSTWRARGVVFVHKPLSLQARCHWPFVFFLWVNRWNRKCFRKLLADFLLYLQMTWDPTLLMLSYNLRIFFSLCLSFSRIFSIEQFILWDKCMCSWKPVESTSAEWSWWI